MFTKYQHFKQLQNYEIFQNGMQLQLILQLRVYILFSSTCSFINNN